MVDSLTERVWESDELVNVRGGQYDCPCLRYTVEQGDTLQKIARTFKTSEQVLLDLNHISDKKRICAGQVLLIPAMA